MRIVLHPYGRNNNGIGRRVSHKPVYVIRHECRIEGVRRNFAPNLSSRRAIRGAGDLLFLKL